MPAVLVVNAGSTSLKLHLVDEAERSRPLATLAGLGRQEVAAAVHRIVHGGSRFRDPILIDGAVRTEIARLEALAPLHNAPALSGISAAERELPGVPQIAVFDTAFHATLPEATAVYALPRPWREQWGIRRFGFHGLSVAWCAERVPALLERPAADLRLAVCHLGGGCSVTAVRAGRSLDTTMGFSPLGGLPMTTRSGSLDPGVLIYAIREHGLDVDALERALEAESGLKGLGGTADMREIEAAASAGDHAAGLAIDVFCHRVAGAVAAMAVAAGGLDAIAFTAGIGEGSALVRRRVCERLRFLGIDLDPQRNEGIEPDADVAAPGSPVRVLVVRAREELVAARVARPLLRR